MEKRAKSVEQAIELALNELGITRDMADIEIISEGSKGFLGIGAKDAVVNVTKKPVEKKPVQKKTETKKKAKKPAPKPEEENPAPRKKSGLSPEAEANKFLNGVFGAMGLEVEVQAELGEDNTMNISLTGDNMGIIIGKRGDTLDSLQYLTSLVVNQCSEDYIKVTLDTSEHYREKRTQTLKELARNKAARVARTGKKFTLEPMNPYERRIIHANLQDNEEVTTYSVGQEPYRKVVIAPKNRRPYHSGANGAKRNGYKSGYSKPRHSAEEHEEHEEQSEEITAQKKGSYTTTYKADFKPQQHKAQYASFEDYLAAQENKDM
ncbi:MAG: protein jag [Clostridiales bacterium]|nr:protein jag [Clostridiales bacterium]